MKAQASLKKVQISTQEIAGLLAKRRTRDSLKKRLDLLESAIDESEREIISLLDAGVQSPQGVELSIRSVERRSPHWKAHYAEAMGAPKAEEILRNTPPTVSRSLVIVAGNDKAE